ncbi:MAG: hypothetical protein FD128_2292 [Hyphomonadaceae bacterium]|nr:MAG: hypothetical protein FD128_2292 [Hyphomonadaceae bacterium]
MTTQSQIRNLSLYGGLAYLGVIITGIFSEAFVRGGLTVTNNPAQTAQNIADNIGLWRLAAGADVFTIGLDIVVALCLYYLLKPTNPALSLLVAFLRIVSLAVLAIGVLSHFLPALLLDSGENLNVFSKEQLNAMGYLSLRLHNVTYHVCLILCGFYNLLMGYLLYKSDFFPKLIGIAIIICGACQFANSFTFFVALQIQDLIGDYALMPALLAELALTYWLIYRGIRPKIG